MILCFSALANYWVEKIGLLKDTCVHSFPDYRKALYFPVIKPTYSQMFSAREGITPGARTKLRWVSDIIQSIEVIAKKINKIIDMNLLWKVSNHRVYYIKLICSFPFSPFG